MKSRLAAFAAATLAAVALCTFGASQAVAAQTGVPPLPIIGSNGQDTVTKKIARTLADGDGAAGARMICDQGYDGEMASLGHTLAAADQYVLADGAGKDRIGRFAAAVNEAYQMAGVQREVAGGSFAIGLSDIATGYLSNPADPVRFWTNQASIGSGILLRVIPQWTVKSPIPTASCAGIS